MIAMNSLEPGTEKTKVLINKQLLYPTKKERNSTNPSLPTLDTELTLIL